jgi:hypothetical protein
MTRQHIADLYFDRRSEAAKKRMQKLLSAKLVIERRRSPTEQAIIHLGKRGFDLLQDSGLLNHYPQKDWKSFAKRVAVSDATIRHELQVMSIKAAFTTAIRGRSNCTLAEFSTWPKLYEFRASRPDLRSGWSGGRSMLMKPDGFIRIQVDEPMGRVEHALFLEVDRGTETLDTLASKAEGYRSYYRSGAFAARMGMDHARPQDCPFRVLLITQSAVRRENVAKRLLQLVPPIRSQVWMTILSEVLADPLGVIWTHSADYATVGKGLAGRCLLVG